MGKKKKNSDFSKSKYKVGKYNKKSENESNLKVQVKPVKVMNQNIQIVGPDDISRKTKELKTLLSQLRHHNSNMRRHAGLSLRRMYGQPIYGNVLQKNMLDVLENCLRTLVCEFDDAVRQQLLLLLSSVFGDVKEKDVTPFANKICVFLKSGLTHVYLDIRVCSTNVLMSLDNKCPNLAKCVAPLIISHLQNCCQSDMSVNSGNRASKMMSVYNRYVSLCELQTQDTMCVHRIGFENIDKKRTQLGFERT